MRHKLVSTDAWIASEIEQNLALAELSEVFNSESQKPKPRYAVDHGLTGLSRIIDNKFSQIIASADPAWSERIAEALNAQDKA